jgi:hypothetical protein
MSYFTDGHRTDAGSQSSESDYSCTEVEVRSFILLHRSPRLLIVAVLASALAAATACGSGLNNPVTPTAVSRNSEVVPPPVNNGLAVFSAMARTKVNICHRTEGAEEFILISVAEPAVDAHVAHGDGRVGGLVPVQARLRLGV